MKLKKCSLTKTLKNQTETNYGTCFPAVDLIQTIFIIPWGHFFPAASSKKNKP